MISLQKISIISQKTGISELDVNEYLACTEDRWNYIWFEHENISKFDKQDWVAIAAHINEKLAWR
jgi:hypothetical protein